MISTKILIIFGFIKKQYLYSRFLQDPEDSFVGIQATSCRVVKAMEFLPVLSKYH
jgi:hypothetical protein